MTPHAPGELAQRYRQVAPRVAFVLMRRFGLDRETAEDLTHDVFAKLIERPDLAAAAPEEGQLFAYVLKAALHRHIDGLRRERRARRQELVLLRALEVLPSPEEEAIRQQRVEALRRAIARLRAPYREIFRLLLDEELSLAEIARRLGSKPGSIYTQFQRGIRLLLDEPKRFGGRAAFAARFPHVGRTFSGTKAGVSDYLEVKGKTTDGTPFQVRGLLNFRRGGPGKP